MLGSLRIKLSSLLVLLIASASFGASHKPQNKIVRLPVFFEQNNGQAPAGVRFLLRDGTISGDFRPDGIVLALPGGKRQDSQVQMRLVGGSPDAAIQGSELLPSHSSYLIGNNPSRWLHAVPNFGRVRYTHVYPGIDLVFYGNGQRLENDFDVEPGADAGRIAFRLQGARKLAIAANGDLLIEAGGGEIRFTHPVAYQRIAGVRHSVESHYLLRPDGTVRIRVGRFDRSRKLVIDPALDFATYLDSLSDSVYAVATDSSGNNYIAGLTFNASYPVTTNAFQTQCTSCANQEPIAFITKLNASGTAQVYSTYLGGSNYNEPSGIAVDANGNAVVTGWTESSDFPISHPVASVTSNTGDTYAFISSLTPDGSALNYSSILGGGYTLSSGIALDGQGNAYITGTTDSPAFPLTAGALKATNPQYPGNAVFVSKFSTAGSLAYSAIVGNTASQTGGGGLVGSSSIAVDGQGSAYITGGAGSLWPTTPGVYATQPATPVYRSVFVTKLTPDGSALAYSTLLGPGYANSIALDANNDAYIAGQYDSSAFPVTSGAYQATSNSCCVFFSKLNADGSQLLYSSFFGGTQSPGHNNADAIRLDNQGNIWLAGFTQDPSFPLLKPLVAQMPNGSGPTSFLSEFSPDGTTLMLSTFIGDLSGAGLQIAIDSAGKVHAAGSTQVALYTTPGAFIGAVTAPPKNMEYTYPFAEVIDPAASGATLCLTGAGSGMDFGYLIPQTSKTLSLTLRSCGDQPLTIQSITASNSVFSIPAATNTCTGSLASGTSCTVAIQFEPSAAQNYTASLTISSNASVPTTAISLGGIGANPVASFQLPGGYPPAIFQPLLVGQTSPASYVYFYNDSPVPLTIDLSKVAITGDFSLAPGGNCAATLPANAHCDFAVTFAPSAAGTRTGVLSVATDDPANPVVSTTLTGTAYASYPIASITALLNPSYPIGGSGSPISVTVEGTNFFPASVVYLNGKAQKTTYQSGDLLSFSLDPAQLTAVGSLPVTVQNPSPGGGSSTSYPLIAYRSIPLTASALVVDPVGGELYAAIPSTAAQNPNTILSIDPSTGAMGTPIAVGTDPTSLAISDDGSELYVASTGQLQRFSLKTLKLEKTFSLPVDPQWGQTSAVEMQVVPGSPQSVVVLLSANVDPSEDGLALYNDSGLVNWLPGVSAPGSNALEDDSFAFTSPSVLYGIPSSGSASFFDQVQVGSSGLSIVSMAQPTISGPVVNGTTVTSDGKFLYTNMGQVWDPASQKLLGTYLEASGQPLFFAAGVIPEPSSGHTYALDTAGSYAQYQSVNINAYSQATYGLLGSVPFLGIYPPDVASLVRWGSNGFAFRSNDTTGADTAANQIVIVTSDLVTPAGGGAPIPVISAVSPSQVASGDAAFTLQVIGSGFTSASGILVNGNPLTTTYVSNSLLTAQVPAADLYTVGQLNVQVTTPAPGGGTSNYGYVSIGPGVELSAGSLNFGNVPLTVSSAPQSVQLYNATTTPLTIASIAAGGDFSATSNCGGSLAAQSSCTIGVVLKPSVTGPITGTLTIADSARSGMQAVVLQGNGVSAYSLGAAGGSSLSASVSSGGTATYNLQLNGSAGFSGNVSLSCSGAPLYATCTVSPSTLTLSSAGSGTFTVTVTTGSAGTSALVSRSSAVFAAGLLGFFVLPFAFSRKRARWLQLCGILAVLVCAGWGVVGCGGGSSTGSGQPQAQTTPAGTYSLTVTASSGTATSTQTLTLDVK